MRVPRAGTLVRASLVLVLVGAAAMLFLPLATIESTTVCDFGCAGHTTIRHVSLVSYEGTWVVWLALAPVLFATVALAFERTRARRAARVVAAALLTAGVLVAALSVGIFFLPAAALMIAAAARRDTAALATPAVTTAS